MKRTSRLVIAVVAVAVLIVGSLALKSKLSAPQTLSGRPMGTAPAGAPIGGPPGGPGQSADFQKSHKYALQLMKLVESIGRLEDDGRASLTPAQAKSILAVLEPLRKRESLEEPAAREAVIALQSVLTDEQRATISALPPEQQFRRNGPPPGQRPSGPPSGPPQGVGPRPMGGFNPLNPPEGGPGGAGSGRIEKLFSALTKKSTGE